MEPLGRQVAEEQGELLDLDTEPVAPPQPRLGRRQFWVLLAGLGVLFAFIVGAVLWPRGGPPAELNVGVDQPRASWSVSGDEFSLLPVECGDDDIGLFTLGPPTVLVCKRASDGTTLWERSYGEADQWQDLQGTPYVVLSTTDCRFTLVARADGAVVATLEELQCVYGVEGYVQLLASDTGRVLLATVQADGDLTLRSLDPKDPLRTAWTAEIDASRVALGSTQAIRESDGYLWLDGIYGGYGMALSTADGKEPEWGDEVKQVALAEGVALVSSPLTGLAGYELSSGRKLWATEGLAQRVVVSESLAFVVRDRTEAASFDPRTGEAISQRQRSEVARIDPSSGRERWSVRLDGSLVDVHTIGSDVLVGVGGGDNPGDEAGLLLLDGRDGSVTWTVPRAGHGLIASYSGVGVVVALMSGGDGAVVMAAFDLGTGQPRWQLKGPWRSVVGRHLVTWDDDSLSVYH